VKSYFAAVCEEIALIEAGLSAFAATLAETRAQFRAFADSIKDLDEVEDEAKEPLMEALTELTKADDAFDLDRAALHKDLEDFRAKTAAALPESNADQHALRAIFDLLAERIRGLIKQVDLVYKLSARADQAAQDLVSIEAAAKFYDRSAENKKLKLLDKQRKVAVEQLRQAVYFHRQIIWLQDRFPDAEIAAVPGLCKVVSKAEIEAADWSLTPGRFVGVAPPEEDEDFDFEQTLRDIHVELADLNNEAGELAGVIQQNLEELGV